MNDRWLKHLSVFQIATLLWILSSQILFALLFNRGFVSMRMLNSCGFLLGAIVPIVLLLQWNRTSAAGSPSVQSRATALGAIAVETLLIGAGAMNGSVAGFQLPVLVTLAKSGLLLTSWQWALSALAIIVVYFAFSAGNSQLVVQSSSGFSSSAGLVGMLIGRELPALVCGGVLVVGIVHAARAEFKHRVELEKLSEHLAELSTELERGRILDEIRTSLEMLLQKIQSNIALIKDQADCQTPEKISETREVAGEALTSIRSALKLLRKVETEQQ